MQAGLQVNYSDEVLMGTLDGGKIIDDMADVPKGAFLCRAKGDMADSETDLKSFEQPATDNLDWPAGILLPEWRHERLGIVGVMAVGYALALVDTDPSGSSRSDVSAGRILGPQDGSYALTNVSGSSGSGSTVVRQGPCRAVDPIVSGDQPGLCLVEIGRSPDTFISVQ